MDITGTGRFVDGIFVLVVVVVFVRGSMESTLLVVLADRYVYEMQSISSNLTAVEDKLERENLNDSRILAPTRTYMSKSGVGRPIESESK